MANPKGRKSLGLTPEQLKERQKKMHKAWIQMRIAKGLPFRYDGKNRGVVSESAKRGRHCRAEGCEKRTHSTSYWFCAGHKPQNWGSDDGIYL